MTELVIYVKDNCRESLKALDIASWIKTFVPNVELKVVNVDRDESELRGKIEGPVYVFNGQVMEVGNPRPEELISFLKLFEERHAN